MKEIIEKQFWENHQLIKNSTTPKDSLFTGNLGKALYYINLYEAFQNKEDAQKTVELTEMVIDKINQNQSSLYGSSLCNGSTGLAFVLHHLAQIELIDENSITLLDDLDENLYLSAKELIQTNHNDFLHGAMGIIFYFLQRLPNPQIACYCHELLTHFCDKAIYDNTGTWFKNIVIKEDNEHEMNFSLSHGQSGFLIILSLALQKGVNVNTIPLLLELGIKKLLQYQKTPTESTNNSFFPSSVVKEACNYTPRLAWCYGDIGVILAILETGLCLQKEEWIQLATNLAHQCTQRNTLQLIAATDSHICHGTAGVIQQYDRLYTLTKQDSFKINKEYWLKITSTKLMPNEISGDFYKGKENDFLEGLIGVNLVYLSYLSPNELSWSKILLL